MAAGHSNMSYYGSRGYRSHRSFDRYQPAMDSVNSNGSVSSNRPCEDQSYDQDYVEVYDQRYEREYGNFEENATHKSGSFRGQNKHRGQNNHRGQARGQGQRGKPTAAEKNSTSSEFGFEGDEFCDDNVTRPQFNHGQGQKSRSYAPRGNLGQEDDFHDGQHHEDSVKKRGGKGRQRGGANDRVDRLNAGDERHTSQNYHDAGHQEKSWRKTGAMTSSDSRDPDDGLSSTGGSVYREKNENERFRGGNVRDGDGYKPRRSDIGFNRGQQNKSKKGSKNTENASQRDSLKYGNESLEGVERPSSDLRLVPEEYCDNVDLHSSNREESVASSVENREFGARKKFGSWRESGQGGKVDNYVAPDRDQMPRGRHHGRRNQRGAFEDWYVGETKNTGESERGQRDVESREDVGGRVGRGGCDEEEGEGENMRDSASQRQRRDVRSVANYKNVGKDSKRQTKGRWDNARYSSDYNNWGGNDGFKRPQQSANRQRVNGNDVRYGGWDPSVGDEKHVDFNGWEERERSKDTSTKKSGSREETKPRDVEMGSAKDEDIRSEVSQPKRTTRDKEHDLPRTANWRDETQRGLLIDQLCAGKYECLVCFNIVRSDSAVWSCSSCFHIYHLYCIKKWAQSSAATPLADGSGMAWRCPTCQNSYLQVPNQYNCFCGKQRDPELNRYATPHSCNETCSRERNRGCPHLCTLLCHPGPCPPCSAFVMRSCDCGKTKRSVKCVGDATSFKCTEPCGRTLNCGQHMCKEQCHAGSCDACTVELTRVCYCGQETRTVRCGSGEAFVTGFTCDGTCGRRLGCERHDCVEKCHPGPCDECPRRPDVVTRCACGKTPLLEILGAKQRETCEDPIATCEKVCDKELACGNDGSRHRCQHRCHEGPCPTTCDRTTEVTCRCGAMTKEVSCKESLESSDCGPFVCDRRCKKKMSCGRHRCNQTCCTSDEHLCQISCGYKLSCGLHRCEEPCHKGNCPSCWQVSFDELRCFCGAQVIYPPVPCGTKPPECNRPCTRQHTCNHSATHHCHSDEVCPPCTVLTEKWCLGRHEQRRNIPCYVVDISCGMQCGRELPCLIHKCQQSCHKGACLEGKVCTQPCTMTRSECGHACQAPCHPGAPCPATVCRAEVTLQCDCGRRKEKGQCLRGHDASSQSDYSKMTAQLVASKLWETQSIDLAVLCKELGSKKTRKLQCNSECSIQERNQRLALALEIKNPDLSSKLGNPTYSQFLKDFAKQNLTFVAGVEKALSDLVTASQQPRMARKIHSFKVMPSNQRRVVHELAEFYGCQTESYDEEPNKNVVATAIKDKCWLPSVTLTAFIQRELFPKAPVPIPINCKEDQIRSAAQAAKQSTQVFSLSGASSSSSSRSIPGGQASGSSTSSNRRNNEPKIDYFDFTD